MAKGVNKVTLLGNLSADPKIYIADNKVIAKISLAETDSYKDKAGEWVIQTQWHYITLFNRLAEIGRDYPKKGAKVYIEGHLKHKNGKIKQPTNKQHSPLLPMSCRCYRSLTINLQTLMLILKKTLMMIFLFKYIHYLK